ncbi:hypothetical protein MPSEU_000419500 [Mayamaea pseudoterrestris]|nr:hypothetical protein MPSEU_000419500 [Mayamaea pseudoterrestris]
MVKVWYEPPPFGGVGTDLNRSPYGIGGGGTFKTFLEKMSKTRPMVAMTPFIIGAMVISYVPVMNHKLPFSFSPEYQAANRAYMRYHNMNPIFGISSKQARATNAE